jgi:ABC-type uncharacterized transport system permease subunit
LVLAFASLPVSTISAPVAYLILFSMLPFIVPAAFTLNIPIEIVSIRKSIRKLFFPSDLETLMSDAYIGGDHFFLPARNMNFTIKG